MVKSPAGASAKASEDKAAASAAFLKALSQAAQTGGAVKTPAGLTGAEADALRSKFYTDLYSVKPIQRIVDNTGSAQNMLAYDVNKNIDPALLSSLIDPFNRLTPTYPPAYGTLGADRSQSLGPVAPSYGQGVDTIGMPQMDYTAPGDPRITFVPQAARPGQPSGMPAAPFIPQAARPGIPGAMPAAPFIPQAVRPGMPGSMPMAPEPDVGQLGAERGLPAALIRDRFPNSPANELNARGVAGRLLDYMQPQRATAGDGTTTPQQVVPPIPYPRPITSGETTMPLADLYDAMNKSISPFERFGAGLANVKIPGSPEELNALIQQNMGGLGSYDPATGRMVIPNATSQEAQAALASMKANDKMWNILGPYVDNAQYTRTPVATDRPVPVDMTNPVPATVPMRPTAPASAPVAEVPSYVSGPMANTANAQYAAQQRAGIDAIRAGGQAAAAQPVPPNRQGQYGALDDLLSGKVVQQYLAEGEAQGEAQKAKRLAEGVDPNNVYDNLLWSMGLYRRRPGEASAAPAPAPASTVITPGNSNRQPRAVTEDVLRNLGVGTPNKPVNSFVKKFGNIPINLMEADAAGNRVVRDDIFELGSVDRGGKFTPGRSTPSGGASELPPMPPADTPDNEGVSSSYDPNMVDVGRRQDAEGNSYAEPRSPGQYELGYVENSAGVRGVQYTPKEGQMVGANGYIYEETPDGTLKRIGKVPGYTDAELYQAANKGAFRDPKNIVLGGTEVAPNGGVRQSALVQWARDQKKKYETEQAKLKADAEAKGEKYEPIGFTDYLSAAASVASGSIPGMIGAAAKIMGPSVIDWLANQPSSQKTSGYDPYGYKSLESKASGSPSTAKRKTGKSDGKDGDKNDGKDTNTGGTGGTGGTLPAPGAGGYRFEDLYPEYARAVFPTMPSYDPGVSSEWDYFRPFAEGGLVDEPRMVVGPGGGKDDKVPARIDNRHEARLSNGEFVITADAVRGLGGGDPQRGAMALMDLNERFSGRPNPAQINVEKVRR
jgi:hypothetical protein